MDLEARIADLEQQLKQTQNIVNQHLGVRQALPTGNIPHQNTGLFIPAEDFVLIDGSPDLALRSAGSYNYQLPGWALSPSATERVGYSFWSLLPNFTVIAYLACPDANAGDVVMQYNITTIKLGGDIGTVSGAAVDSTVITVPGAFDTLFIATFDEQNFPLADNFSRIVIGRNGSVGTDTYASDVWFLGARIF